MSPKELEIFFKKAEEEFKTRDSLKKELGSTPQANTILTPGIQKCFTALIWNFKRLMTNGRKITDLNNIPWNDLTIYEKNFILLLRKWQEDVNKISSSSHQTLTTVPLSSLQFWKTWEGKSSLALIMKRGHRLFLVQDHSDSNKCIFVEIHFFVVHEGDYWCFNIDLCKEGDPNSMENRHFDVFKTQHISDTKWVEITEFAGTCIQGKDDELMMLAQQSAAQAELENVKAHVASLQDQLTNVKTKIGIQEQKLKVALNSKKEYKNWLNNLYKICSDSTKKKFRQLQQQDKSAVSSSSSSSSKRKREIPKKNPIKQKKEVDSLNKKRKETIDLTEK